MEIGEGVRGERRGSGVARLSRGARLPVPRRVLQRVRSALPADAAQRAGGGVEFGGAELSKGERQKMALSRVFYRNLPIFILDEPTAAIDSQSTSQIFRNIENVFTSAENIDTTGVISKLKIENGNNSSSNNTNEILILSKLESYPSVIVKYLI